MTGGHDVGPQGEATEEPRVAPLVLRGGRVVADSTGRPERLDIAIGADGRISELGPDLAVSAGVEIVDLGGRLVCPGLVDMHQHLDKTRTRAMVVNADGTLGGAVAAFRDFARKVTPEELSARARRTIDACLAHGTTAIRTHANVDAEMETRGVRALVDLRDAMRERMTIQIVAFLTSTATRRGSNVASWLEEALDYGADVVGGAPALAEEPEVFLDLIFEAALRHDRPIDLHLDEHLDPGRQLFDAVIDRTRANGLGGRVVAGHCSVLSAMPPAEAHRIIDRLVESGIGVVTLPAANLFLQGRDSDALAPRGLTRVSELLAAGVTVAAASDNIQDPFVPTGSGDLLEIARWTVLAGHFADGDLPRAFDLVTSAPARLMGIAGDYGIRHGARADLLISDAEDVADLIATGPLDRAVMVGGRIVAGSV